MLEVIKEFSSVKKKNFTTGFTVVEMVVVLAISVILSSILIIYSGDSRKFLIFSNERSLIVSAIFKAKSYSLETYQPTQFTISGINPTESICGWGVRFEKNPTGDDKYYVYKDVDSSGTCSGATVGHFDVLEPAQVFEKGKLDKNILKLNCLDILTPGGSCLVGSDQSSIDVFFQPPDPKVIFNPDFINSRQAVIRLEFSGGGCSVIKINRSSQI
ncbi:MAG: type II secretion system protein, partial [Candidatus Pacebacteria bacterium]|nr:type II secretion system protein [Candidatus Paceibacterota bacterium]